ncbi:uncharacterized protein LOC112044685 isoform X3 [Bicyclus anynana]|uniref:Uncharacterized protein LOC112044685 isoform X3 n=1 Tax=Bicyclus anynana TaxID=110368 RepID=A0ABM3LTL4_BICAN|nr:uncharacterized protein LOC112044685 isoform X3 [Bicyclus anynana]
MVWDTCSIVLHGGSNGSYFTNEIVTGSVVLELKRERKLEQMFLNISGKAKAMWTRPLATAPYVQFYSQTKKVLYISLTVFRELQGKTVGPGVISCQFDFMLPPDIPPTFKDSIARVRYKIKLSSKNVSKMMSTQMTNFIVEDRLNLNHIEEYMKIVYNITSGSYNTDNIICKTKHSEIISKAREIFVLSMDIPQIISSTTNQSEPMVDISYVLQVKVNFRFHLPIHIDIPVIVASIPVTHGIFFK